MSSKRRCQFHILFIQCLISMNTCLSPQHGNDSFHVSVETSSQPHLNGTLIQFNETKRNHENDSNGREARLSNTTSSYITSNQMSSTSIPPSSPPTTAPTKVTSIGSNSTLKFVVTTERPRTISNFIASSPTSPPELIRLRKDENSIPKLPPSPIPSGAATGEPSLTPLTSTAIKRETALEGEEGEEKIPFPVNGTIKLSPDPNTNNGNSNTGSSNNGSRFNGRRKKILGEQDNHDRNNDKRKGVQVQVQGKGDEIFLSNNLSLSMNGEPNKWLVDKSNSTSLNYYYNNSILGTSSNNSNINNGKGNLSSHENVSTPHETDLETFVLDQNKNQKGNGNESHRGIDDGGYLNQGNSQKGSNVTAIPMNLSHVPVLPLNLSWPLRRRKIQKSNQRNYNGTVNVIRESLTPSMMGIVEGEEETDFDPGSAALVDSVGVIVVDSSLRQPSQPNHQEPSYYPFHRHNGCPFNPITIYLSSSSSLILILVTMVGQMVNLITSKNNNHSSKSSYILINLLISLAFIEIIFLLGAPLHHTLQHHPSQQQRHRQQRPLHPVNPYSQPIEPLISSSLLNPLPHHQEPLHFSYSSYLTLSYYLTIVSTLWTPCKMISMILHYLHLVAAFTMLTHSIYLYKKLWHYTELLSTLNEPLNNISEVEFYPNDNISNQLTIPNVNSPSDPFTHHNSSNHLPSHPTSLAAHQQRVSPSSAPVLMPTAPPASHSTEQRAKALTDWNQANLHKEPETVEIVSLLLLTWFTPLLCVIISIFINPFGYETKRYCWMSIEGGMMFSFIVPVSLLIMSNTIIMLLILKRFFAYKPITHKIEIERVEPSLRSGVSLLPFFAVNWFLSVLALEDVATNIFQYLFALTNLVQHLLVFLFHCYQRPEIHQRLENYLSSSESSPETCGRRFTKGTLKCKRNYWHPGHCSTVPLLVHPDDGSARLHDSCFDDPTFDQVLRFKDQ